MDRTSEIYETIKCAKILTMRVTEREERKKGQIEYLKK